MALAYKYLGFARYDVIGQFTEAMELAWPIMKPKVKLRKFPGLKTICEHRQVSPYTKQNVMK